MGIGFKELLIILAIALLIFGAKRLKTIGSDLGGAVKGFKWRWTMGTTRRPAAQFPGPERRRFRLDACLGQDGQQVQRLISEPDSMPC